MMHSNGDALAPSEATWVALADQLSHRRRFSRGSIEWPEDEAETSSDAIVVRESGRESKQTQPGPRRDAHPSEESYAGSEPSRAGRQRSYVATTEIEEDSSQEPKGSHLRRAGSGLAGAAAQRQRRRVEQRLLREASGEMGENPGHTEVVQNAEEAQGTAEPELEDVNHGELTRHKRQPRMQILSEEDSDPGCQAPRKQKTESLLQLKSMKAGKEVEDGHAPHPPFLAPSAAELANRIKSGQFWGGKIVDFTGRQRGSSDVLMKPRFDLKFNERGGAALHNGVASRPVSGILKSIHTFAAEQEWGEVGLQPKSRNPRPACDAHLGQRVKAGVAHSSPILRWDGQTADVGTEEREGSDQEGGGRKEAGSSGRLRKKLGVERSRTSSSASKTPSEAVSPGGSRTRARLKDLRLNPNELMRLQHQVPVSGGDSKASSTAKTSKSAKAGGGLQGGPELSESPRVRRTLCFPLPSWQGSAEHRTATIPEALRREGAGEKQVLRESSLLVKHDRVFCDWKVLVAARDWEKHRKSPNHAPRYQVQILPDKPVGPGVYELGLLLSGGSQRPISNEDVMVVYVGHADNIRTRLQKLGHGGLHLGSQASSKLRHATSADVRLEGGGKVKGVPSKPVCRHNSLPEFLLNDFSGGKEVRGGGEGGVEALVSPRLRTLPPPSEAFSSLPPPSGPPSPTPLVSKTSGSGGKTPLSGLPGREQWMTTVEWEEKQRSKSSEGEGGGWGGRSGVGRSHGGGPNLFQAAFDRGYSVVFRWAKAATKESARATETSLLAFYDYAWNASPGDRRAIEVLELWEGAKEVGRGGCLFFSPSLKGVQLDLQKPKAEELVGRKKEGVENVGKSREETGAIGISTSGKSEIKGGKSGRGGAERGWPGASSPKHLEIGLVKTRHKMGELAAAGEDKVVMVRDPTMGGWLCAASIGLGNVCPNKPLKGKERCALHRGMKVYAQVLREI